MTFRRAPRLPSEIAAEFERLWSERAGISPPPAPAEVDDEIHYMEGAVSTATVNRYERDPAARAACLEHYGYKCQVCAVSPSLTYGPEAADLIEVHLKVPLYQVREIGAVDPVRDLVPVCPNCHAMLHHGGQRTVEEVRAMVVETEAEREAELNARRHDNCAKTQD